MFLHPWQRRPGHSCRALQKADSGVEKMPPMSCGFSPVAGIPKARACRRRDVNYGKYLRFAKSA